jgi:L-rhamnose mutarotase
MFSIGLTFKLRPGCYPEYKKAHDELWPAIQRTMAANEINMVIYYYKDRLFLHATAPTREGYERNYDNEAAERWVEYMSNLIETDDQGELIFEEMEEAFSFGEFKN